MTSSPPNSDGHAPKCPSWKTAVRCPTEADISAWTQACGQPDAAAELLAILSDAQAVHRQWRLRGDRGHATLQDQFDDMVRQAARIRNFEILLIPGLLQIPGYARYRALEAVRVHGAPWETLPLRRVRAGLLVCDPCGMTTSATAPSGAHPYPGTPRNTNSYVIAVMNQKGGVGKTMVTLALAAHTAAANGRALVVDVDPQSTAYDFSRLMQDPGYDVVSELNPAELTRLSALRDYDTIIVDCPGSLEGEHILDEVLKRATYVVIPYTHDPEIGLPTIRTANKVSAARIPYGVVVTKADPRLGADFITDAWQTMESKGVRHFRSVIREYRAWPNSLKQGIPITRYNERYAPRLRQDIAGLHTELLLEIGRLAPGSA